MRSFPRTRRGWMTCGVRSLAFPGGRHDDQVDSIAQFLDWSRLRTGRTLMAEFHRPL